MKLLVTLLILLNIGCNSSSNSADEVTLEDRIAAAEKVAFEASECQAITPFYWEVGDRTSVLASGSEGNGSVNRATIYAVASATKWMFGAYVLQAKSGVLTLQDQKALRMQLGYTSFGVFSCGSGITTVLDCHQAGSNDTYTSANDGFFFYGGGHYQKWAVDYSLGAMTRTDLAAEFKAKLGSDIDLTFGSIQLAGGVVTNAENYAKFLQKILSQNLRIHSFLGSDSICTNTSCPTAASTPINEDIRYSYGHWVESAPSSDGAFSSAGLFGFYPWIDSSKTYYGVISRYEVPVGGSEIGSGQASMLCGRKIRKAFATGSSL